MPKHPPLTHEDDNEADDLGAQPVDWDAVTALQARYDAVDAIADPDERVAAARALVAEMNGGE